MFLTRLRSWHQSLRLWKYWTRQNKVVVRGFRWRIFLMSRCNAFSSIHSSSRYSRERINTLCHCCHWSFFVFFAIILPLGINQTYTRRPSWQAKFENCLQCRPGLLLLLLAIIVFPCLFARLSFIKISYDSYFCIVSVRRSLKSP